MRIAQDFWVRRLPSIRGRVRSPKGEAVPSASVYLTVREKEGDWTTSWAVTDENGEFSVAYDSDGEAVLSVTNSVYEPVTRKLGPTDKLEFVSGTNFKLKRKREEVSLAGKMSDTRGRAQVPDTMVLIGFVDGQAMHEQYDSIPVGEDGSFRVALVRGYRYTIQAWKKGYAKGKFENITVDSFRDVRFVLKPK